MHGPTGATAATRYAGGTTSGAPVSGTFSTGDYVIAQNGHVFVCTAGGSPGTWADAGSSSGVSSLDSITGAVTLSSGGGITIADNTPGAGNIRLTNSGVTALDSITGGVSLVAGTNISIADNTPGAGQITITATGGGGGLLTSVDAHLSGDVTITSANTFFDGPSASFAAGTWFITWMLNVQVAVATAQSYWWTGKLWDGTTAYDESEITLANPSGLNFSGSMMILTGFAIVTLGGTTTLKASAASGQGSSATVIKRNAPDNSPATNQASRLVGLKIA